MDCLQRVGLKKWCQLCWMELHWKAFFTSETQSRQAIIA